MAVEWLIELLKGIGRLFLHPVFFYLVFLAAVLGVSRVKRERKSFHVRAENAYFELRQLLPLGVLVGLIISVVTIGVGIAIPFATILFTAAITFLWSLTTKVRLLAPAYTVGFAFFATIIASSQKWDIPIASESFKALDEKIYPSIAVLIGILLIGEGILIAKNAYKGTSPKLVKSKRGLPVGVHEVKRLWVLPVFLLIPGEAIKPFLDWWPVFNVGGNAYSIILVPFAVGFHQQIQGTLPKEAVKQMGRRVILFGSAILLLSLGGYWLPVISIGVVAVAIIGRELLTLRQRLFEENLPFYFSKKNHGLMILGVIPDSPASKMALQVGELITKVNGVQVFNEKAFYEALQKNRAHCKLEVLDTNGQVRFVQRALYEGDHHQLGVLFVQDEKKWESEAV